MGIDRGRVRAGEAAEVLVAPDVADVALGAADARDVLEADRERRGSGVRVEEEHGGLGAVKPEEKKEKTEKSGMVSDGQAPAPVSTR